MLVPCIVAGCQVDRSVPVAAPRPATAPASDGFEVTSSKDGDTSAGLPILPDDLARATIPARLHGRWGLVAADCAARSDSKGLISIGDRSVRFYEALATLEAQRPSIGDSFAGLFAFAGEGRTWRRVMTFSRVGNRLKRSDDTGQFSYLRCP